MASPSRDSGCNLRIVGSTCSPQSTVPSSPSSCLRFRTHSIGSRCSITTLAGAVDVHVAAVSLAEQGLSETLSHSKRRVYPNSPMVEVSSVVSTCNPACGSNSVPSIPSRTAVLAKSHL